MARTFLVQIAFAAMALALASRPAAGLDEVRLGLMAHNIQVLGDEDQSNEGGVNVVVEAVGGRIRPLAVIGGPRPYALASINTQGDTSFAAIGLYWRWNFAERWSLEPGFGFALHDGADKNPYPPDDPRAAIYQEEHQILGADVLFRDTLALERQVGERGSLAIVFEHLSNGGAIFGHDSNQSLNNLGLRYSILFD